MENNKKSKDTKRSLVMSLLSMMLCCAMLIGATYAWFTDSVESSNNNIVAGNLDVELEYATEFDGDATSWEKVTDDTDMFAGDKWEPGFTKVVYLKVTNNGEMALKFKLGAVSKDDQENHGTNVAGQDIDLRAFIAANFAELEADAVALDRAAAIAKVGTYTVDDGTGTFTKDANAIRLNEEGGLTLKDTEGNAKGIKLESKESKVIAFIAHMPTDTGNEANHNGKDIPKASLTIKLEASQYNSESDSFDADYDKDAAYADGTKEPGVDEEDTEDPFGR